MTRPAIRVEGVGKRYPVAGSLAHIESFRDAFLSALAAPLRLVTGTRRRAGPEVFWALEDVSFEVDHGQAVGVIGRNGAGKSTLLKIMTGITEPTVGRVELTGRVASLLEVGTGFHPELTGRENVFLNGAILGMTRQEVRGKFDEIVAFAEIERFIDTPVKHYSSGMYMRLAFSVAAHLDQEILLVDEVLAVGDVAFQKKCLAKMDEVAGAGRTVVFVAHNMGAVRSLCPTAILLDSGRIAARGSSGDVISQFLHRATSTGGSLEDRSDREGNGRLRFTHVEALGPGGLAMGTVLCGDPVTFRVRYRLQGPLEPSRLVVVASLWATTTGELVCLFAGDELGWRPERLDEEGEIFLHIPHFDLRPGGYVLKLFASERDTAPGSLLDSIQDCLHLSVLESDRYGSGYPVRAGPQCLIEGGFSLEAPHGLEP